MEKLVNGQDKKDLNVILERMDQADKDRDKIHQDIKFIKENSKIINCPNCGILQFWDGAE